MVCHWLDYRAACLLSDLFREHVREVVDSLNLDKAQTRLLVWIMVRALSMLSPRWAEEQAPFFINRIREEYLYEHEFEQAAAAKGVSPVSRGQGDLSSDHYSCGL
jgi:hypothetical protein